MVLTKFVQDFNHANLLVANTTIENVHVKLHVSQHANIQQLGQKSRVTKQEKSERMHKELLNQSCFGGCKARNFSSHPHRFSLGRYFLTYTVARYSAISRFQSNDALKQNFGITNCLNVNSLFQVVAFAVCNLPFHARKMWQYWSPHYHGNSNFSAIFTPLTVLCTYFNSGVNPLLYAFLSKNFRR